MQIKVCGMRDKANITALVQAKPDYIGFIFYAPSKRYVGEEFPIKSIDSIPKYIQKVGVFVNASIAYVAEKCQQYKLDIVQLHGHESPEYCQEIKKIAVKVIKAFHIDDNFNFDKLIPYQAVCDYFLFDTKGKGYGGNGVKFNWEVLKKYNNALPIFLSGGIGLADVESIKNLQGLTIQALDVNSKFELEPALKDIEQVNLFIKEIRS